MAGSAEIVLPAKWFIGPPAPRWLAFVARACMIILIALVGHWVQVSLGGVGIRPTPTATGNDTSRIFNWHPVLMTLAFGVFMAEAVLTYQAPVLPWLDRDARKKVHWALHSAAWLCIALGLAAAFNSHNLKLPTPIPNMYSPHSFLGITTVTLAVVQFALGFAAYLFPRFSLSTRLALGPCHRALGCAVWVMGLATIASGLQEKATFLQMGKSLSGDALFSAAMRLPATAMIFLALLGITVLYFQVPPAKPLNTDRTASEALLAGSREAEELAGAP